MRGPSLVLGVLLLAGCVDGVLYTRHAEIQVEDPTAIQVVADYRYRQAPGQAGNLSVEASAKNLLKENAYVREGCGGPWKFTYKRDGQAVQHERPPAPCSKFSWRPFRTGTTLPVVHKWEGYQWDANRKSLSLAPPGQYTLTVTFEYLLYTGPSPPTGLAQHANTVRDTFEFRVAERGGTSSPAP